MKKAIVLAAVTAVAMLVGPAETAKADHYRHCSPYSRSYSSFGFSYGRQPSYYSYRPSYYSYSRPSYGFSYARPGFSITLGSGYNRGFNYYNRGFNYGRSYGYGFNRGGRARKGVGFQPQGEARDSTVRHGWIVRSHERERAVGR